MNDPVLRGVVHGKMIELDHDSGLPERQVVTVIVRPQSQVEPTTGKGLEQSFGGWADDADDLDEFLEWNRLQRKKSRSGMEP